MQKDPTAQQPGNEQPSEELKMPYVGSASIHISVVRKTGAFRSDFEGKNLSLNLIESAVTDLSSFIYRFNHKEP